MKICGGKNGKDAAIWDPDVADVSFEGQCIL